MGDLVLGTIGDLFDSLEPILEAWKKSVSFDDSFDEREVKVCTERQRQFVNPRPAANKDAAPFVGQIDLAQFTNRLDTGVLKTASTQDDRRAIGQRLADRFKGSAAHHNRLSCRHLLE